MSRFGMGWLHITVALVVATALTSCAVFDRDNRRVLNWMDESIQPTSATTQIALAPVMIPLATVALATDAVVVHPVASIPKAWDDVYALYWTPREMTPLRTALIVPITAALTPPTFVGDLALRCLFPID